MKKIYYIIIFFFFALITKELSSQCPPTNLVLTPSFTDSCGNGSPINVTLTNNSTNASLGSVFDLFQNGSNIGSPDPGDFIIANLPGVGSYQFMLTYDEGTCQDTVYATVTYSSGIVTAGFTVSSDTVCAGSNITFTNTSVGSINTYSWVFGNGNTANTSGPHTQNYPSTGNFNVQLTVSGSCGNDTHIEPIVITPGTSLSFIPSDDTICLGNSIQFTNTSNAPGPYSWDFDDGNTSTSSSPIHTYNASGTYSVELSNSGGSCSGPANQTVVVVDSIHLNVSGDDGDGDLINCLPWNSAITSQLVTFANTSSGATSYTWNFGDGSPTVTTNTPISVNHTYNTYGLFQVIITANNTACSKSDTLEVLFMRNPKSQFTVPLSMGCEPLSVTPVNQSSNGEIYIWDFGDLNIDTLVTFPAPSNDYANGVFFLSLSVINECGTDVSTFSPIVSLPKPIAAFSSNVTEGCPALNVSFVNASQDYSPSNNFKWNFGDGSPWQNNVPFSTILNHTYNTSDTFTVTLIAGGFCGTDTATSTIIVYEEPLANFSITPSSGCLPSSVNITNLTTAQFSNFQWHVNGVPYTEQDILNSAFLDPLVYIYNIQLTASNPCGVHDTTITVTYSPATVANFTISDNTLCLGDNTLFTSTSSGNFLNYEWDFDNGNTSILLGPHNQTYNTSGSKDITLIVVGACGSDTITKSIQVFDYPVSDFSILNASICKGQSTTFTNNSTPAAAYQWTFSGGNPSTSNLFDPGVVSYANSGLFEVQLVTTLNGCSDTQKTNITVNALPGSNFTLNPINSCSPTEVTITNNTINSPGNIYNWTFSNGNTQNVQNPLPEIFNNPSNTSNLIGEIKLVTTTSQGCKDSVTQNITVFPKPLASFTQNFDTVCALQNVQFTNQSVGATAYSWNFGDGSPLSNSFNSSHSYNATGDFTITLIVQNGNNCFDTVISNIFVQPAPTSSFTFNTVCLGDTTVFINNSLSADSVIWNFGDGSPLSHLLNPKHKYLNAGNYSVSLVVFNTSGCFALSAQNVSVLNIPIADFSSNTVCLGKTSSFTNSSSNANNYLWNFGDGSPTSTQVNPTHSYSNFGTYSVTLIAYNNACSDTIIKTVEVDSVPTADFNISSVCALDSAFFVNNSLISPDSFIWNFGDASPLNFQDNPGHAYSVGGSYSVTLIAGYSWNGCFDTITKNVNIFTRTVPDFLNTTICFGQTTDFTDLTQNAPTSWSWNFGDGFNATGIQNPSHTYLDSSGTYMVTLITESSDGCIDSIKKPVLVNAIPKAGFTFDTVCLGLPTSFNDTSWQSNTQFWDFGDGTQLSNVLNPTHTFSDSLEYTVQLIAFNGIGCTDTITKQVKVLPKPSAGFTADTVCFGEETAFTDTSLLAVDWTWYFGDASPPVNFQNPSHTYLLDNTYIVSLVVEHSNGCKDSISKNVLVYPIPNAGFTQNTFCEQQNIQFSDTSLGGPTQWVWNFGDGSPESTVQNPSHTFSTHGNYTIQLIVSNGVQCSDTIQQIIFIDSIPQSNFSFLNSCKNDTILFTNTSLLSPDTFYWDFGNGNIDSIFSPSQAYITAGNYQVMLIAGYSQTQCFDTLIQTVYVFERTNPDFTSDSACYGYATSFTDNTQNNPVSWIWNFGDGNSITGVQNPTHTYNTSFGNYFVTLTTQNIEGCIDSITKQVFVKNSPEADFIVDSVCLGSFISVSDISTGNIVQWNWTMGNGALFLNTQNFTYTYPVVGEYDVTLVVTNDMQCTDTLIQKTKIFENPIANFTADTVCFNLATTFTDQSIGANDWNWFFNDGSSNTSIFQNPNYIFVSDGIFQVKQIVESIDGCKDSIQKNVLILSKPISDFFINAACANDTTRFFDNTANNPTYWEWNFGDGSAINYTQNPNHVYTQGGNYTVNLITSNNNGCFDTLVSVITAYTTPIPDFTADTVCMGSITQFNNLSSDIYPIVWTEWDFGDAINGSYSYSPGYIYQDSGLYQVTLYIINDKGCDSTVQKQVYVKFKPEASFIADTVCFGLPTSFTSTSTGNLSEWIWDFGDGTIDTVFTASTTHTYSSGGNYLVSLTNSIMNCSDVFYKVVTVNKPVEANIYLPSNDFCFNFPIQFTDSSKLFSGSVGNITWNFGDGNTSSIQHPIHTYSTSGSFDVYLAVSTLQGCVDTAFTTVVIHENPTSEFTINPSVACEGHNIQFVDASLPPSPYFITNWDWDFGLGVTSNVQNPNFTFSAPGIYYVQLIVTNNAGCKDTTLQPLEILTTPEANFLYSSTCSNEDAIFEDASTGNIVAWQWDFGDGNSSTLQDPTHSYNINVNSIDVQLIVEADNGCKDTVVKTIDFFPLPILDFRALNGGGCAPFKTSFTDNSYVPGGGSNISYWFWDFGDGNYSYQNTPAHTYTQSGNYEVILTVTSDKGCSNTDTLIYPILVYPGPQAGFDVTPEELSIMNPEIEFYDESYGADYLFWIVDNSDTLDALVNQYTFSDTGWHSLTQLVANNYGCTTLLDQYIYVRPEFKYYVPNTFTPNIDGNNELFIGQGIGVKAVKMLIFDRGGRIIFESYDLDKGWNGKDSSGETMKSGLYQYQIFVTDIFGNEHFYTDFLLLLK